MSADVGKRGCNTMKLLDVRILFQFGKFTFDQFFFFRFFIRRRLPSIVAFKVTSFNQFQKCNFIFNQFFSFVDANESIDETFIDFVVSTTAEIDTTKQLLSFNCNCLFYLEIFLLTRFDFLSSHNFGLLSWRRSHLHAFDGIR